ncbi:hypothetical protein LJC24_05465, partial [Desulfococcaceae bacterium OttesenSCG-928-F15]|nr:hypothetical protein [Desulfococcaceae bacterium OttesenSCG-928-F15]
MKKYILVILAVFFFLLLCCVFLFHKFFPAPLSPEVALDRSLQMILTAQKKTTADDKVPGGIRWLTEAEIRNLLWEAEAMLTSSIDAHPGHRELLTRRSEIYFMLGEMDKMLADLERLIAVTGGWPEILMFRCMILEKKASPEDDFFTCYEEVCERYRKKETPAPLDYLNWAFAELMAGHPEKTEILLEESRKSPELMTNETWNLFLEPDGTFNRKNF